MHIKKVLAVIFLFLSAVVFADILISNLEVAINLAKIEHKKLAIIFTTSSCPYCVKLKNETLTDETVRRLISANYVFAEAMFDYSRKTTAFGKEMTYSELFTKFQVNSVPMIWFFTQQATPIAYLPGYVDAQIFAKILRYVYQDIKEDFQQYIAKNDDFAGNPMILAVSPDEAEYVLKNDQNSIYIEDFPGEIDLYKIYITPDKNLAEKLVQNGVFRVLLVK